MVWKEKGRAACVPNPVPEVTVTTKPVLLIPLTTTAERYWYGVAMTVYVAPDGCDCE